MGMRGDFLQLTPIVRARTAMPASSQSIRALQGRDGWPAGLILIRDSVDKLRHQNGKLKTELRELSSKLEEYLSRAKQKRQERHYGIHAGEGNSEAFRSKEKELVSSQSRI